MTKRYLLVCGGTGKGLVDKRNLVGVDGVIQFDVVAEELVVRQDNKTLNFTMPYDGDETLYNTDAVKRKIDDLTRSRASKLSNVELIKNANTAQIADYERLSVLHANDVALYKQLKDLIINVSTPPEELRSAEIRLDSIKGNVEEILKLKRSLSSPQLPYLTLLHDIESIEKQLVFYKFVLRDLAPASLADGMAQMPIIGSSYFNRSEIMRKIDEFFANMTAQNGPVANEPIEVFIISSMCGGTGQGISHHVGLRAAKYFRKNVRDASISIRFIRVGALTYNSIGSALRFRTKTNAAMAILHDAALAFGQQVNTSEQDDFELSSLNHEKALADFQFFYLETPDVGVDKKMRMQDIEIACRAIMNEELSERFQKIMVNIGDLDWFKGVFVRVGYWANEVDVEATYRETIEQLRSKVSLLVRPNYSYLTSKLRIDADQNSTLLKWMSDNLVEQKEPSKVKDIIKKINPGSFDEESIAAYIQNDEFKQSFLQIQTFLQEYIGLQDKQGFAYDLSVGPNDPQASLITVAFDQQIAQKYSVNYINNVVRAHDVRAMALRKLAGGGTEKSTIERLFVTWNSMAPSMFDSKKAAETKIRGNVKSLFDQFVLVRTLTQVVGNADKIIDDLTDWLKVMVDYIKKQQDRMPAQSQVVLTSSAELTDLLDSKTWLASIHDTLVGNLQSPMVENNFKAAVVWGSRGLTSHGLRHVMAIPQQASSEQVVAELNSRAGKITIGNIEEEAKWWQGQNYIIGTPGQFEFSYRVLPPLPADELFEITRANDEYASNHGFAPNYIEAPNAFTGLKVLSVECVRSQRQLVPLMLNPLLASLQLNETDGNVERYIQRLASSSIGEPIYLTDEMNERIGGGRVDLRKWFITFGK
jgi:hypothetical protein